MIRFVVLATPRSGSNWLCSLLDSHPAVLCHHELFNPEGIHVALSQRGSDLGFGGLAARERDPEQLLARAWAQHLGHAAVGFKLNRGQAPAILARVLADPAVRKIVIRRRNRIRSLVSERIAEVSGAWESYAGLELSPVTQPVLVPPAALRRHAADNRAFYDHIAAALKHGGQQAFELAYEEVGDPAVQRRLLTALEVAPDVALKAGTRRQNPAPLPDLIANFAELAEALKGTDLEAELWEEAAPLPAERRSG